MFYVVENVQEDKFNGDKLVRKQYYDSERMRLLPNEAMVSLSCINFVANINIVLVF